jgi:hypothetical protein
MRYAFVPALVVVLGCKNTSSTSVASSGSGSAREAVSATAGSAAASVDAASGPWKIPANATTESKDADATALGTTVVAHFVERVQKPEPSDKARSVKTLLVLEGAGKALVVDETDGALAEDDAPSTMALAGEAEIVHAPLTPPRAFQDSDSTVALEVNAPMWFLVHLSSKAEKRDIAVVRDNDALVVWTMVAATDSVDVAPSWEQTGAVKLAAGTTVTAPAVQH